MADAIDEASAKTDSSYKVDDVRTDEKKEDLPPYKNEPVLKKRPDAISHAEKCEQDRSKLEIKERDDKPEPVKKEFTPKKLESPKFEKFIEYCTKINEVAKERTATSKANIKKGKDLFTFPML